MANAPSSPMIALRLRITGRVQGVGFRAWCINAAKRLNVQGWVRNASDGSVEAIFTGTEIHVHSLVKAAYGGPPQAQVEGIDFVVLDLTDNAVTSLAPGFVQFDAPRGTKV